MSCVKACNNHESSNVGIKYWFSSEVIFLGLEKEMRRYTSREGLCGIGRKYRGMGGGIYRTLGVGSFHYNLPLPRFI